MAEITRVEGLEAIKANLKAYSVRQGLAAERGLLKAGFYLQRKSQQIVPVEFGVLKASAFTRPVSGAGLGVVVGVGYTAEYAPFVHENPDAAHGAEYNKKHGLGVKRDEAGRFLKGSGAHSNARGPNQQYKFLEKPMREEKDKLFSIIADAMGKV